MEQRPGIIAVQNIEFSAAGIALMITVHRERNEIAMSLDRRIMSARVQKRYAWTKWHVHRERMESDVCVCSATEMIAQTIHKKHRKLMIEEARHSIFFYFIPFLYFILIARVFPRSSLRRFLLGPIMQHSNRKYSIVIRRLEIEWSYSTNFYWIFDLHYLHAFKQLKNGSCSR